MIPLGGNQSIRGFLEAICTWMNDADMMLNDDADWAEIAKLFLAGTMYE